MKMKKASVPCSNTPSYMKPTSSFEAKRKLSPDSGTKSMSKLRRTSSLEKTGGLITNRSRDLDVKRATCSSTLKHRKFPPFLSLNPGGRESEGVSTVKVCPYVYCSLNGHYHASLTALKRFISAKRKMIKAQKCSKPVDLVEEIIAEFQPFELNSEASELEESAMTIIDEPCFDCCADDERKLEPGVRHVDEHFKKKDVFTVCVQEIKQKSEEGNSFAPLRSDLIDEDTKNRVEMPPEPAETHLEFALKSSEQEINGEYQSFESDSEASVSEQSSGLESCKDEEADNRELIPKSGDECVGSNELFHNRKHAISSQDSSPAPADNHVEETTLHSKKHISSLQERHLQGDLVDEDHDTVKAPAPRKCDDTGESRHFNPKEPNFLPSEPDKEAEKVDLKHQELDDRRNSEEWMVDYALRQVVTKLRPARRRKVALLVEAFEKVMPTKSFNHPPPLQNSTPIQPCR